MDKEIEEIKRAMDNSILKKMYPDIWKRYEFGGYGRLPNGRICFIFVPKT